MNRITVLMPTYNVAPWVEEAVRSVLRQTYADFELLMVDDGSTDGTVEVVQRIADPRIRIAAFPDNVGLADNLNRGLDLIGTEYMARMDGDDIAMPTWLEEEMAIMTAHPEVGICSAGGDRFGTRQSTIRFPEHHEDIAANMLFECSVAVPLVRMSLLRDHGLRYRPDAFPAEDYRMWAECLRHTRLHNLQRSLFRYRMHESQICSSRHEEQHAKVAEVRRYMLAWLSDSLTDDDCRYFIDHYTAVPIASADDFAQRRAFARRLLQANAEQRHFDPQALGRCLDRHLSACLLTSVTQQHFADGYSLPRYLHYLRSGLALRGSLRNEARIAAKSLLHRPQ